MNGARRWKVFVEWWDREFPSGRNLDKWSAYKVVNMVEDKVFELKSRQSDKESI